MGMFDFGERNRMHLQMYGNVDSKDLMKAEQQSYRRNLKSFLYSYIFIVLTLIYFSYESIPTRLLIFLGITVSLAIWKVYSDKQSKRRY